MLIYVTQKTFNVTKCCELNASGKPIGVYTVGITSHPCSVNTCKDIEPDLKLHDKNHMCLLYDRRLSGIKDKFVNSILHNVGVKRHHEVTPTPIFK